VATPSPVRGGAAIAGGTVAVAQLDGVVLGLELASGAVRWRYELGAGLAPEAASVFATVTADDGDFLIGNQRHFAVIDAASGRARWTAEPVPGGSYSQSLAAAAAGDGVVIAVFHRELGGVVAWDRVTGRELWRLEGELATAINATPVIADGVAYLVNGLTEVMALDALTGEVRWQTKLDPDGFDWGSATVGVPALARGILVVPTLYGDLVALDAASGAERWRRAGTPSPLRTTHYRGAGDAGFAAGPAIVDDVVWAVDTAGRLGAVELSLGVVHWEADLGTPVLAGLGVAPGGLVVASVDGTVRLLAPADPLATITAQLVAPTACDPPPARSGGCCQSNQRSGPASSLLVALVVLGWRSGRRHDSRARSGHRTRR
jgi:outer membrane protein assembly factor BamB